MELDGIHDDDNGVDCHDDDDDDDDDCHDDDSNQRREDGEGTQIERVGPSTFTSRCKTPH